MSRSVPPWPVVDLVLKPGGSATVNGRQITVASEENPRDRLLKEATAAAVALGRPLRVRAEDPSGTWHMIVDPGGAVTSVARPDPSARPWVPETPRGALRLGDVESSAAPAVVDLVGDAAAETKTAGVEASARAWYRTPQQATDVNPARAGDESGGDPSDPPAAGLVAASLERREVPGRRSVPARWQAAPPRDGVRTRRLPLRAGFAVTAGVIALLVAAAVTSPQSTSTDPAASSAAATTVSTSAVETEGSSAGGSDAASPSSPAVSMVKAPPGYQTKPLWAWPVPGWTKVAVTDDGAILTRSAGGQLLKVDATTGAVMWSSADRYGSDWDGPWLTSIDAQPVLALASSTTLAYWPLASMLSGSSGPTPATTPGTLVPLPAGARVSWVGSSPLITSPPGAVGLIRGGVLQRVNVPAGARALSTDGRDVLAVQGGRWLKVGAATQVNAFRAPAGAAGAPVRVEAVSARFLLAVWPLVGKSQPIELIDAGTGTVLLQGPLPAGIDITRGPVIRQVSGTMTAVGPVVVDTDNLRVNALERSYKPLALTKGRVYATSEAAGRPVDIHLSNDGTFAVVPFTADQAAVPFATTSTTAGRVALALVADDASGWLLTALAPAA